MTTTSGGRVHPRTHILPTYSAPGAVTTPGTPTLGGTPPTIHLGVSNKHVSTKTKNIALFKSITEGWLDQIGSDGQFNRDRLFRHLSAHVPAGIGTRNLTRQRTPRVDPAFASETCA